MPTDMIVSGRQRKTVTVLKTMKADDHNVEAKLHDESRMIPRCFDDNKGDEKKLKGQ